MLETSEWGSYTQNVVNGIIVLQSSLIVESLSMALFLKALLIAVIALTFVDQGLCWASKSENVDF